MLYFFNIFTSKESLAHKDRILENVLYNKHFYILDKKYYRNNKEYYNINNFLFCYCDICYHLNKQVVARKKPVNKKKLFSFCYSNFCNMV